MIYKPDYGLKLLKDGISKDVIIDFPLFTIYNITILDYEKYSTLVEISFNNKIYTLSVYFNQERLEEILKFAPKKTIRQVNNELNIDMFTKRTINLEESFTIDFSLSLGELEKSQDEKFVPFFIKNINCDNKNEILQNEFYFSKEEIIQVLHSVNIDYDMDLLYKQLQIVNSQKNETFNFYTQCLSVLDLISILEIKNIALSIYEGKKFKNSINTYTYLELIKDFEIDFKLFILLAGEEFLTSEYYEYDGKLGYEQVLEYLIFKHYNNVVKKLMLYYKDSQNVLLEIIKDLYFYNIYFETINNVDKIEDCFDSNEIIKLSQWANTGFNINGKA